MKRYPDLSKASSGASLMVDELFKNNPTIAAKVLQWRETLPKGSIMRPETFSKIVREAKKKGYKDPVAVAGEAYWTTLMAKYRKAHLGKKNPHWAYTRDEIMDASEQLGFLRTRLTPKEIEAFTGISPAMQDVTLKGTQVISGYPEKIEKLYKKIFSEKKNPSFQPMKVVRQSFYTIRVTDVGKPTLKIFGRVWPVSDFIGKIMTQDVGKRVYLVGGILQVENEAQLKVRLAREGGQKNPKITLPDGRIFPAYEGKPLSWDPGLYFTSDEGKLGYPKARAVLAEMDNSSLDRMRREYVKASFDRMFGHHAKKFLALIEDEIKSRIKTNPSFGKIYVGVHGGREREIFRSAVTPTKKAFPQYNAVIGPFRTMKAALLMKTPGSMFQDVAHAERYARTHSSGKNPIALTIAEKTILDALVRKPKHWSTIVGYRATAHVSLEKKGLIRTERKGRGKGYLHLIKKNFDSASFATLAAASAVGSVVAKKLLNNLSRRVPKGAVKIYDKIYAIEAQKGGDSNFPKEDFRHDFTKKDSEILGMPDGSLVIKSRSGKRLWKNFNYTKKDIMEENRRN